MPDIESLLRVGDIDVEGRMPYSSNATFLVDLRHEHDGVVDTGRAIYKPLRGGLPVGAVQA